MVLQRFVSVARSKVQVLLVQQGSREYSTLEYREGDCSLQLAPAQDKEGRQRGAAGTRRPP